MSTSRVVQFTDYQEFPLLRLRPQEAPLDPRIVEIARQQLQIPQRIQGAADSLAGRVTQRGVWNDWRARFAKHSLQTEDDRMQAAIDVEWLLQTESLSAVDVDPILRMLLPESMAVAEFRMQMENTCREKMHADCACLAIEEVTLEGARLLQEAGEEASLVLGQERRAALEQRETLRQALQQTADTVYGALEDGAQRVEGSTQDLKARMQEARDGAKYIDALHEESMGALQQAVQE